MAAEKSHTFRSRAVALGLLGFALIGTLVFAQDNASDKKPKPYAPRKIVLSPQPVTKDEARKVLDKMSHAFVRVIPAVKPAPIQLAGKQPVTRAEIIEQFARIFEATKPNFKKNPSKASVNPGALTVKEPAAKEKLETLIAWKCVDPTGPLATGNKETMGVLEFGDAVGLMIARLADLTHTPNPRFSPNPEP